MEAAAAVVPEAVPLHFTWCKFEFELEHSSEAEPDVGLAAGVEYCSQLDGDGYVTVWTHDGGASWCAQLEQSVNAGEPVAEGTGPTPQLALQAMVDHSQQLRKLLAQLDARL